MAEFPYVKMCPDCVGLGIRGVVCDCGGIRLGHDETPCTRLRIIDCTRCNGRGHIIPEEWTSAS